MEPFKTDLVITLDDYRRYYFNELLAAILFYLAVGALGAADFPRYLRGEMLNMLYMFILPVIGLATVIAAIFVLSKRAAERSATVDGITNWHFDNNHYTITPDGTTDSHSYNYKDAKKFARTKHDYFITQPDGLLHIIHASELEQEQKDFLERCFSRAEKPATKRYRTTMLSMLFAAPMAVVMIITALVFLL